MRRQIGRRNYVRYRSYDALGSIVNRLQSLRIQPPAEANPGHQESAERSARTARLPRKAPIWRVAWNSELLQKVDSSGHRRFTPCGINADAAMAWIFRERRRCSQRGLAQSARRWVSECSPHWGARRRSDCAINNRVACQPENLGGHSVHQFDCQKVDGVRFLATLLNVTAGRRDDIGLHFRPSNGAQH